MVGYGKLSVMVQSHTSIVHIGGGSFKILGGLTVDQGGGHLSAVVNTDMIWGAGPSTRYAFGLVPRLLVHIV